MQAISKSGEVVDKNIETAIDSASIAAAKREDDKKEIKEVTAQKDAVIAGRDSIERDGKGR
ncbi:Variable outer membrane protein [Borrelia duttonii CR2A]|uniref:Variable outer membrane protein n=1 Tax=Borrelia duttonii CR2A TaxID=1432657 RepID=W6TFN4_9SPIR|nr:Variable outer membrane protein [Borrelia duttonii CR2A]